MKITWFIAGVLFILAFICQVWNIHHGVWGVIALLILGVIAWWASEHPRVP